MFTKFSLMRTGSELLPVVALQREVTIGHTSAFADERAKEYNE